MYLITRKRTNNHSSKLRSVWFALAEHALSSLHSRQDLVFFCFRRNFAKPSTDVFVWDTLLLERKVVRLHSPTLTVLIRPLLFEKCFTDFGSKMMILAAGLKSNTRNLQWVRLFEGMSALSSSENRLYIVSCPGEISLLRDRTDKIWYHFPLNTTPVHLLEHWRGHLESETPKRVDIAVELQFLFYFRIFFFL